MDYYQTDCDLLSDLPLGIIHIILALVPIREAVRTCILSRKWRYIWTSLPQLVFDDRCASKEDTSETKYEDFITRVLFRHNGPIHNFKVSCSFERPFPILDEWVYFLSRNDIRDLVHYMGYDIPNWLQLTRSSIYSCKELTNLELLCCELNPPPLTFKGFLFLKSLNLNRVELSPSGIESLVSICPLLERLVLIKFQVSELSISGPNLKYLELSGDCRKICLYAPLLAEMSVEMSDSYFEAEYQQQNASVCTYTKLLGGLTDLEILSGSCDFTKYLSIGIESCHSSLVFHHLKLINLIHMDFRDAKEISVVVHLLVGAPNLRELIIRNDERPHSEPPPHLSFMDFEFAHDIKLEKLRAITMSDVSGLPFEIEFLKFLLESSPGLETMTVDTQTTIGSEEKQNLRDELLGCSFASLVVELTIFKNVYGVL